jgi:hypothetical protein
MLNKLQVCIRDSLPKARPRRFSDAVGNHLDGLQHTPSTDVVRAPVLLLQAFRTGTML